MRKEITIVAEQRTLRGKNEARRLRASGSAPAVLYGGGGDAVAVAVKPKEINRILFSKTGHNTIFDIAVAGGETTPVMIEYFEAMRGESLTVVSPDAGGVERARAFAKRLGSPLAIIDKRRTDVNVAEVMHIIGDVEGQHCLIVDDLIDTAGTLVKACEALLKQGARSVRACATHAVLSGPAVERIENSELEEGIVTNSIPLPDQADNCKRIKPLSVAPLLAKAIQSVHEDGSVSTLFV